MWELFTKTSIKKNRWNHTRSRIQGNTMPSSANSIMSSAEKTPQKKRKIENSSQKTQKAPKQPSAKSDAALRQASANEENNTNEDESNDSADSSDDAMEVVDKQNESEKDSDDDEKRRKRVEREKRRLSTPRKTVPTYRNKELTDVMKARNVFEATSGSNDSVDFYVWKKKNWKDGALVSSTPSPPKKVKQSPKTSSTKKSRWTKVGHKIAKEAISKYVKDGDAIVQKRLSKKLKKKGADEIRQIATDGIEFLEKVAFKTTPDFIVPIADKDVHHIIENADLKQYWSENVKCANIDEATKMRDDIERDFAKIRDDFVAQESIYVDKVDLLNWRLARKANTYDPNIMAHRVLTYIHDHCDEDLGSGAEEEEPKEKSDEDLSYLGSDKE